MSILDVPKPSYVTGTEYVAESLINHEETSIIGEVKFCSCQLSSTFSFGSLEPGKPRDRILKIYNLGFVHPVAGE